jgi:hypothetical protein
MIRVQKEGFLLKQTTKYAQNGGIDCMNSFFLSLFNWIWCSGHFTLPVAAEMLIFPL